MRPPLDPMMLSFCMVVATLAASNAVEGKLEPSDEIKLTIQLPSSPYKEPPGTLDGLYVVDSKGDILLPHVSRLHIAGFSEKQAVEAIEAHYKKYLAIPEAQVKLSHISSGVPVPAPIDVSSSSPLLRQIPRR